MRHSWVTTQWLSHYFNDEPRAHDSQFNNSHIHQAVLRLVCVKYTLLNMRSQFHNTLTVNYCINECFTLCNKMCIAAHLLASKFLYLPFFFFDHNKFWILDIGDGKQIGTNFVLCCFFYCILNKKRPLF